jgi:hypothetical protein
MHNEGVYIPFPSCALKPSNLHIQFYLLALTILNDSYLLRMIAKGSRSDYNVQVRFILMTLLCSRNNSKVISKFVLACPAVLRFRAGSLDVKVMLLHHNAMCYIIIHSIVMCYNITHCNAMCYNMTHCIAICYNITLCNAMCYITMCYIITHFIAMCYIIHYHLWNSPEKQIYSYIGERSDYWIFLAVNHTTDLLKHTHNNIYMDNL